MGRNRGKKIHLVVIDPQVDFCEPGGALYVAGAQADMDRLTKFVVKVADDLEDIHITMDSHHYLHIAHPVWWRDSKGNHPKPFTLITEDDVLNGVWRPTLPSMRSYSLEYVRQLKANGRYVLCIWPPHCLIGSDGHKIMQDLFRALLDWESRNEGAFVDVVTKGSNVKTEHYSAVRADVPDNQDHTTQLNTDFIGVLQDADELILAGEALSHCVANTFLDIADFDPEIVKKMVLLEDATSSIPGFEKQRDDFLNRMISQGMRVSTTQSYRIAA